MKFWPIGVIVLLVVYNLLLHAAPVRAAPPPVDPRQPRPDIFQYTGIENMQLLNPTNVKALRPEHTVNFRLTVMPGCNPGSIPNDINNMIVHARENVKFNLVRNDVSPDFTVFISCGNTHIQKCGSVNVFCLPDGFPYNTNVYISDVLSSWPADTRLSILLHEIMGHAIATWNEQYDKCAASCGFLPTPNWYDFMNTGSQSRHGYSTIELGRWERTMYLLTQEACVGDPCYDGTLWRFSTGWKWNPATDEWFDPKDRLFWIARDQYGWRFSPILVAAMPGGGAYWTPDFGHLIVP